MAGLWTSLMVCWLSSAPAPASCTFLVHEIKEPGGFCHLEVEPYCPQPGDILLWDDHNLMWKMFFLLVGSHLPSHSSMVVQRPDGQPAILESSFTNRGGPFVCLGDFPGRMASYEGTIWVRRLKCPLDPEQCAALTEFSLQQEGKLFAFSRMFMQATPFRARGHFREMCFGKTDLERHTWLCSELVVAAGTVVGLFDSRVHANCVYPADLLDDKNCDLSATWLPAARWSTMPGGEVPSQH